MKEIKINYLSLVGNSTYNVSSDICTICRESIYNKCIKCSQKKEDIKCCCVIGECNHAYHYCCMNNWISSNTYISKNCPLCNNEWKMKKK